MSLEAAKKLLSQVNRNDFAGKSEEEIADFLKESGCTLDELKKAYILSQSLSEGEMEKVSGGGDLATCTGDYYKESCSDTVEYGSNCIFGDQDCWFNGRNYYTHCVSSVKRTAG